MFRCCVGDFETRHISPTQRGREGEPKGATRSRGNNRATWQPSYHQSKGEGTLTLSMIWSELSTEPFHQGVVDKPNKNESTTRKATGQTLQTFSIIHTRQQPIPNNNDKRHNLPTISHIISGLSTHPNAASLCQPIDNGGIQAQSTIHIQRP